MAPPPQSPPDTPGQPTGQSLWGGRFSAKPADVMQAINVSIGTDQRLWRQDIEGSRAHCDMLAASGIIGREDADAILSGLDRIEAEIHEGRFPFREAFEDIHMNIEARLAELIGEAAGRLHTARSRNDQVATDFRLWVREQTDQVIALIAEVQHALLDQAERHADVIMPGFTHLQPAQPVTFGHHLMAYVEMLARDRGRFEDARARLNECPLGAAALAGSPFPIDRHRTAAALGFERPMRNSLDAVSARDFALEVLAASSILGGHLSRLSEEIVVWMTPQFGFVRLPDDLTTGSSIMPQKRNPDAAELVRAKTGRLTGAFVALSTVMKGLPLAYSKDMQEDKPPVFEAMDALMLALNATLAMVRAMRPDEGRMLAAAGSGYSTATDLADWLVRELNLPFRQAHHITGRAVIMAETAGVGLDDLSLDQLQSLEPRIHSGIYEVLSVTASVNSRQSHGGTAPDQVRARIRQWKEML